MTLNPWRRIRELEHKLQMAEERMRFINDDHARENMYLREVLSRMETEMRNAKYLNYMANLSAMQPPSPIIISRG